MSCKRTESNGIKVTLILTLFTTFHKPKTQSENVLCDSVNGPKPAKTIFLRKIVKFSLSIKKRDSPICKQFRISSAVLL